MCQLLWWCHSATPLQVPCTPQYPTICIDISQTPCMHSCCNKMTLYRVYMHAHACKQYNIMCYTHQDRYMTEIFLSLLLPCVCFVLINIHVQCIFQVWRARANLLASLGPEHHYGLRVSSVRAPAPPDGHLSVRPLRPLSSSGGPAGSYWAGCARDLGSDTFAFGHW